MPDREELYKLWNRYGTSFESDSSEGYELADAILASDWLAAHDREVAARAWDEGYGDDLDAHTPRTNPYRKENSSEREDN